jgi:hypothetical protein
VPRSGRGGRLLPARPATARGGAGVAVTGAHRDGRVPRPNAAPRRPASCRVPPSPAADRHPRCPGHRGSGPPATARRPAPRAGSSSSAVLAVQPADRPGRRTMLNVRTVELTCLVPMAKRGSGVHVRRRVCSARRGADLHCYTEQRRDARATSLDKATTLPFSIPVCSL